MKNGENFYKKRPTDKTWWFNDPNEKKGELVFSFDRKKTFNLFADYPWKLTKEQKEIFDNENPYWKEFFSDRQ